MLYLREIRLLWMTAFLLNIWCVFESCASEAVIESDEVIYIKEEGHIIFKGNVECVKDDVFISAPRMKAELDAKTGDVIMVFCYDKVKIKTSKEEAFGSEGQYDVKNGVVKLRGGVVLMQGKSKISGDELVHVKDQTLLRSNNKQRVSATLYHDGGIVR